MGGRCGGVLDAVEAQDECEVCLTVHKTDTGRIIECTRKSAVNTSYRRNDLLTEFGCARDTGLNV